MHDLIPPFLERCLVVKTYNFQIIAHQLTNSCSFIWSSNMIIYIATNMNRITSKIGHRGSSSRQRLIFIYMILYQIEFLFKLIKEFLWGSKAELLNKYHQFQSHWHLLNLCCCFWHKTQWMNLFIQRYSSLMSVFTTYILKFIGFWIKSSERDNSRWLM